MPSTGRPLGAILCALLVAGPGGAQVIGEAGANRTKEHGIEVGLSFYGDVMLIADGGLQTGTAFAGLLEPTLLLDLGQLLNWNNTRVFVRGLATFGNDPAELTGAVHAPSNFSDSVDTIKLYEAWVERRFLDDSLSVLAGLYGVDTEFDVSEAASVFINGGFGTGIEFSQSGLNGPCIFPTSCLGLRVRYVSTSGGYMQVAVLDGVAGDPEDPRRTQIHLDHDDGLLVVGEAGVSRNPGEQGFLHAAVGAWHYTTTFDDLLQVDVDGNPYRRKGTQGLYALLEGDLYREPGHRTQGLSAFVRFGMADDDVNQIRYSTSGGFAYTGVFERRGEDVTAVGFSVATNGDPFMESQSLAGTPADRREVLIGLTHLMPVSSSTSVQFDAQYIVNPGMDPAVDDAVVLGVRYWQSF